MAETTFKKVRLFKVSRETNVSVETLLEHLEETGFKDALTGSGINAAITEEDAYLELLEEFAEDKEIAARIRKKRAAREESQEEEAAAEAPQPKSEPVAEVEAQPEPQAEEETPAEVEEPAPEEPAEEEPIEEAVAEAVEAPVEEAEELPVADPSAEETVADAVAEAEVDSADEPAPAEEAQEVVEAESTADEPVAEEPAQVETPEKDVQSEAIEPEAIETPTEQAEVVAEADVAAEGEAAVEESTQAVAEAEVAEPAAADQATSPQEGAEQADSADAVAEAGKDAAPTAESTPAAADEPKDSLKADRYKLAGTRVIGKIDLAKVEKDTAPSKKKKRKRIDKATPSSKKATPTKAKTAKKTKKKGGPVVDDAAVEKTLQETLRELEAGASRARQRRRRQRRDERAAEREQEAARQAEEAEVLRVTEFVSTGELANLLNKGVTEIISTLFKAGMMVSINQRLDADTITFVAAEFGRDVEFITEFSAEDIIVEDDDPEDLQGRAPVITVMGHVDHGKTSLLDHIRSASVVAGEAGGITQHIGAYAVQLANGREVTFLDTPGHEAFTAMRARGAQVTDIVILVVAADDAVMPQTIEAINHARAAEVPIVVAVNKIDKPAANTQRVMQGLADHNVLVEQYGGKVQCAMVSAKTGEGIEDLMDKVILEAELLELKANPDRNAVGVVIESRLEKGRGTVATILVQNGSLRVGDAFVSGIYSGRVRAMYDERDRRIEEVGPARPALVSGLSGAPEVGESFIVVDDESEARDIANKRQQIHREQAMRQRKHITLDEIGRRLALGEFQELNLIVKADVGGSVEAVADSLLKLSTEEVAVNIVHKGVGAINESDVVLASASDAIIIGFQVRPMPGARLMAEHEEIDIRLYSVIYHAIEEVRDALEGLLSPERSESILGVAEVRETFKVPKVGMIAGCFVTEGKIRRSDRIHLIRDGVVIYEGTLASLKRFKDDVREVVNGYECGMGIENFNDIKVGDQIEAYEIIETRRTLEV